MLGSRRHKLMLPCTTRLKVAWVLVPGVWRETGRAKSPGGGGMGPDSMVGVEVEGRMCCRGEVEVEGGGERPLREGERQGMR